MYNQFINPPTPNLVAGIQIRKFSAIKKIYHIELIGFAQVIQSLSVCLLSERSWVRFPSRVFRRNVFARAVLLLFWPVSHPHRIWVATNFMPLNLS